MAPNIHFRDVVQTSDPELVRGLTHSTNNFSDDEVDVAVELVEEALHRGAESGYWFLFAEVEGATVSYACYGPIALTQFSYDLYWIVVHRTWQGCGVGRRLLAEVERRVAERGGRQIYIETSGRDQYLPTRRFYENHGYQVAAVLPDFYTVGDPKVIFVKRLCELG